MKIVLTGGSGFIGTRLTDILLKKGCEVRNLDIRPSNRYADYWNNVDIRSELPLQVFADCGAIFHLAAVHRDDVRPLSLYAETNVEGTRNVCRAAEDAGIRRIIFTSSVAVYGFAPPDTGEDGEIRPFNEYGRTKYDAEAVLRQWQQKDPETRSVTIIRPTVVFGEGNRGNVFNLLGQINSGKFAMVGKGENRKSMAYVENVAAFLEYCTYMEPGVHVINYVDKPDFTMNELVSMARLILKNRSGVGVRLPLSLGLALGFFADVIARLTGRSLPVSLVRVQKFVSNTCFASRAHTFSDFTAPVGLRDALERTLYSEFINPDPDAEEFLTE